MVRPPTPSTAPARVNAVPALGLKAPPPAFSMTGRAVVNVAVVCRVPLPKESRPAGSPRLLSAATATAPPLIARPPLKVLMPLSVSVPVPTLISEAPVLAKDPPSLMVPLTAVDRLLPPTVSWLPPRK
jgi:hypothetical protein